MALSPGIYIIRSWEDESLVLSYDAQTQKLGAIQAVWPRDSNKLGLQWSLQRGSGSTTWYHIRNVETQSYLKTSEADLSLSTDSWWWELELIKPGVSRMKVQGLPWAMSLPRQSGNPTNSVEIVKPNLNHVDQLWCFKPLSELLDEKPDPSPPAPQPQDSPPDTGTRSNKIIHKNSNSPYADDPHFHTDMLFNMPRTPLTRIQRAAALEWVRKLGATDVPTMESFDECERALEAKQNSQSPSSRETNPYGDDAHFYTYMLFNMPRASFTRTQRAMALEWARRLGAANVPTIDSFDECERILDSEQNGGNK